MKFIVDEMPNEERKCPFSTWKAYPPIIEKIGDWFCKHDNKVCYLSGEKCRWMKQEGRCGGKDCMQVRG